MRTRHYFLLAGALSIGVTMPVTDAASAGDDGRRIGMFTTVHGTVEVQHPKAGAMIPAIPFEEVLFRDVIETKQESKTKALFDDDSMLSVGENSRVEITEHVYDPDQSVRRMIVKLVKGSVRALVSRVFTGEGSKFEVHTPSAVAAARGTYFVVWMEGDRTGVANIGSHGRVDFSSGGQTIALNPFQYSTAAPGVPPVPAAVFASNAPPAIRTAVSSTEAPDAMKPEPMSQTVHSLSGPAVSVPPSVAATGAVSGKSGAPGQTGSTPGLAETAPGRNGRTPGQTGAAPPGLALTTPGQSGTTPPFVISADAALGANSTLPGFGSRGAAGRRGFVPPGHGGTPPGLDGGTPPGLGGSPPGGGAPPGPDGGPDHGKGGPHHHHHHPGHGDGKH